MEGSSKVLNKGAWTAEEDSRLRQCIDTYGEGIWSQVPLRAGLKRCRKSCRLRWVNYLNPNIKKGEFSSDEVDLLIRLHKLLGNRWSLIADRLPGRTANDVKSYWNTNLAKKQETYCTSKITKREELNIVRYQPQSFSNNKGCGSLKDMSEAGLGGVRNEYGSIKCNKGKEKCNFVNNVMDDEKIWRNSLLEENQEVDEGDNCSVDSMCSTYENLECLFNADTREFTYLNQD